MKHAIKSSIEWNNINRIFYLGLYKSLHDERYLQIYYTLLNQSITQRGRYCPHYRPPQ